MKRSTIYSRDGNICRYCEVPLTRENATIDHILPKSKGGINRPDNYVAACRKCNLRKGNKLISPVLGIGLSFTKKRPIKPQQKLKSHKKRKQRWQVDFTIYPDGWTPKAREIHDLYLSFQTDL